MLQISFQRDGYDFHIRMRVGSESHSGSYRVVVDDPEGSEPHAVGIIVVSEAEAMRGLKPSVVGVTAGVGFMKDGFFHTNTIKR